VTTAAAAVSALTRYTRASFVPDRPIKFLFDVLRETPPDIGLWLLPMQKPQALSMIRAPAAAKTSRYPCLARFSRTCLDPVDSTKLTSG